MLWVEEHRLGQPDYVWTASTLGGNPISTTAAYAALQIYRHSDTYPYLHGLGEYLRQSMRQVLDQFDTPAQVIGDGPLAQVIFSAGPVYDYRSSQATDPRDLKAEVTVERSCWSYFAKDFSQSHGDEALPVTGSRSCHLR